MEVQTQRPGKVHDVLAESPTVSHSSSSNLVAGVSSSLIAQTSSSGESSRDGDSGLRFVSGLRRYFDLAAILRTFQRNRDSNQPRRALTHGLEHLRHRAPYPRPSCSSSGLPSASDGSPTGGSPGNAQRRPGIIQDEPPPSRMSSLLRHLNSRVVRLSRASVAVVEPPEAVFPFSIYDLGKAEVDRVDVMDPRATPLIVVVGVGYVGEHLVNVFSRNYDVIGYDISPERATMLSERYAGNRSVKITADTADIRGGSHFLISVPTLLREDKSVDTSYLTSALDCVAMNAERGSTVVFESSVAIGMTRELLGPIAVEKGFYAGMSPERVDPGREEPPAHEIPKIVSGLDDVAPGSLEAIRSVYGRVFDQLVVVSKPEVAEMMKLYENCQRMMCIAFANEMADACGPHGIDPFEVCRAAATKPFGYMPMMPSLGVGGHCIPVNPYYLLSNSEFPLLQAATEKMNERPGEIARRALERAQEHLPTLNLNSDGDEDYVPDSDDSVSGSDTAAVSEEEQEQEELRLDLLRIQEEEEREREQEQEQEEEEEQQQQEEQAAEHTLATLVEEDGDLDQLPGIPTPPTEASSSPRLPRMLIVGIGFKAGQSHLVNSPGLQFAQVLSDSGEAEVSWCDPLVTQSAFSQVPRYDEADWTAAKLSRNFDMIIVAFRQHGLDFSVLKEVESSVEIEMWCP